jgi:hypothetical protein
MKASRIKIRLSISLVIIALSVMAMSPSVMADSSEKTHRLVLIVAGQSNGSGARSFAINSTTGVNYLAAPYATAADKYSTITWDETYLTNDIESSEVPLDTPQYVDSVQVKGHPQIFGPEIGLARSVYASTKQPVTIIKVTFPATTMDNNWVPGDPLWNKMVSFVKTTIAKDSANGQVDTIGGFYWVQGESDSIKSQWASLYKGELAKFVPALRVDLPIGPKTPIVLAKTWVSAYPSWSDEVRAADDWAAAQYPYTYTVDTKNLARYSDNLHLINTSEITLGDRMAKVDMP